MRVPVMDRAGFIDSLVRELLLAEGGASGSVDC